MQIFPSISNIQFDKYRFLKKSTDENGRVYGFSVMQFGLKSSSTAKTQYDEH
jgi:hypothetical protein